ncbi:hypothetical protein J2S74_000835 [Evansella vedderi]|uniref:NERD domain-containing protein n=1 Tax=Evansella vedderi TaxID=38282 RepID=A0ABT9ZSK5_9BACI|nr:nuclease-related domain-containing protein [Evansella vedderi]MDQ0253463.1 hypothetical protein [Evansella vedderi]
MISKPLTKPIIINQLEALLRRLPQNYISRPKIEGDLAKYKSGYRGQMSLNYYFNFLDEKELYILQDLRLPYKDSYFQIDVTIVCQYFISLLEVKNNAGLLEFDLDLHQLKQTYNGMEKIYDDPVQQVQRQSFQLNAWLTKNKFAAVPSEYNVVISNPSAYIVPPKPHQRSFFIDKIIRPGSIQNKIQFFQRKYRKEQLTKQEVRRLVNRLIKSHTPKIENVLEKYQVSETDIIKGVHCPNCSKLPMIRHWGTWYCQYCGHNDPDAHLGTLKDRAFLLGREVTNQQVRNFLNFPSISTATRILHSMELSYVGTTKSRIYFLPPVD